MEQAMEFGPYETFAGSPASVENFHVIYGITLNIVENIIGMNYVVKFKNMECEIHF